MRDESSTELPGVGDVIGNWRIIGFLGDGRSGIVFKVRERNGTERIGALKLFKGPFRRRHHRAFAHEIGIVERQIVPGFMPALYGRGRWRRRPFFVMQLVDAIPGELSTRHARRIMDGAASALGQLHARHYLHCDVKPENLGLVNGRVVLIDFGSARPFADADKSPNRVGTWVLMAPEVREKLRLDVRSDIYSLGATLNRICSHTARRTFDDLILRATANNPEDRPQTIEEFRRELNTAQDRLARFRFSVTGTALVLIAVLLIMAASHLHRRADILRRIEKRRETKTLIVRGLTHYQTCDFANAYINLHAGMASDEFHPEDYQGVDVKSLHDDSLRRLREAAQPPP